MQAYSDPTRASDPHALPDIEVFQLTAYEVAAMDEDTIHEYMQRHEYRLAAMNSATADKMYSAMVDELGITGGWFYWSCFPGCLPDGPAIGPYNTAADALAAAREE